MLFSLQTVLLTFVYNLISVIPKNCNKIFFIILGNCYLFYYKKDNFFIKRVFMRKKNFTWLSLKKVLTDIKTNFTELVLSTTFLSQEMTF